MILTLLGITRLVKLTQLKNAWFPMLVRPLPKVTLVSFVQSVNARTPILVTLLGIVTLVTLAEYPNAWLPMEATGRPVITAGIATAPPGPVYCVIVMVPLLVV